VEETSKGGGGEWAGDVTVFVERQTPAQQAPPLLRGDEDVVETVIPRIGKSRNVRRKVARVEVHVHQDIMDDGLWHAHF